MSNLRILNCILIIYSRPLEGFNQRKEITRLLIFFNSKGIQKNRLASMDGIGDFSFRGDKMNPGMNTRFRLE